LRERSWDLASLRDDADRALRLESNSLLRGVNATAAPEAAVRVQHPERIGVRRFRLLTTRCGEELVGVAHGVEDQQAARVLDTLRLLAGDAAVDRRQRPCAHQIGV